MFVAIISSIYVSTDLMAEAKELTVQWDPYTTPVDRPATAFKLFVNARPQEEGMTTLAASIPTDSTRWKVTVEVDPGDTLWFAMQAVNRQFSIGDPNRGGEFTPWVPWVFFLAPKPPIPPQGLRITTTFELINP